MRFNMPVLQSPADAVAAMAAIAAEVAQAHLTPGEASELSNMWETTSKLSRLPSSMSG